jgi:hypothetical protein
MPTNLPVVWRRANTGHNPSLLGISNDEFYAVALFSGIGLLATLIAIICGVQGCWF